MKVESLHLENFRNYEKLDLSLNEGTNLFYGDNAQGKTNILEAVYLCGTTKSHRGSKDREIIRFDQDESHIRMNLLKNEISPFYCDELPSDTDYVKHLECFLRFTEKRPAFAAYRENFLHLLDQY